MWDFPANFDLLLNSFKACGRISFSRLSCPPTVSRDSSFLTTVGLDVYWQPFQDPFPLSQTLHQIPWQVSVPLALIAALA
jgi:hypothetical protein